MSTDDDLTPGEREALARLEREIIPPEGLEERTLGALRREGLIAAAPAPGVPWLRPAWAAIGLLIALGLGLLVGRASAPQAPTTPHPDFLLILRAGSETPPADEAELRQRVAEYAAWAQTAAGRGELVAGEKLHGDGRFLQSAAGGVQTASLPDDGAAAIQGYFLIRSASYADAARIAGGCPHLRYGGTIELRRIERFEEERS